MSDRTAAVSSPPTFTQKTVSFLTEDGGEVSADVYGEGGRGIVLAHGGRFNKESWKKQARTLAARGFWVLALDFRGYGKSQGPGQFSPKSAPLSLGFTGRCPILPQDGYEERVGSRGQHGRRGGRRCVNRFASGEINRAVFLGSAPSGPADKLKSSTLFIVARDDANEYGPRLPGIRAQYEKAPEPKKLIILDGSAHARFLF